MITVTTEVRGAITYIYSIHSSNLISVGNEVPNNDVTQEIANQETIINNYINS